MKTYLSILFLFLGCHTFAQKSRELININQNWSFAKDVNQKGIKAINKWQTVSLPHTWNAFDVMDDEPGYYRGIGWYKKKLILNPEWKSKKIYLYLEGANQETEVYLNGTKVGSHVGGYTAFTFALNGLKFNGGDQLEIKVNNRHNESIPPLTGDFTFFGGIYRSISLLVVDPIHFEDEKYASSGVFAHADKVSKQYAELNIKGNITNQNVISKPIKIVSILRDKKGKIVGEVSAQTNLAVGQTTFSQ
ncbi:MAG: glycoside hydrolase family 2, partial [Chitinophagaceae bacterium]